MTREGPEVESEHAHVYMLYMHMLTCYMHMHMHMLYAHARSMLYSDSLQSTLRTAPSPTAACIICSVSREHCAGLRLASCGCAGDGDIVCQVPCRHDCANIIYS